jgi:hypothetical protein
MFVSDGVGPGGYMLRAPNVDVRYGLRFAQGEVFQEWYLVSENAYFTPQRHAV